MNVNLNYKLSRYYNYCNFYNTKIIKIIIKNTNNI